MPSADTAETPTTRGFTRWRKSRPFGAGLCMILAGLVIMTPAYLSFEVSNIIIQVSTISGVSTFIIGALLITAGLMTWFGGGSRILTGVASIILGLVAMPTSNFGGFIIGTMFALVGGALALSWSPAEHPDGDTRRERKQRRAERRGAKLSKVSEVDGADSSDDATVGDAASTEDGSAADDAAAGGGDASAAGGTSTGNRTGMAVAAAIIATGLSAFAVASVDAPSAQAQLELPSIPGIGQLPSIPGVGNPAGQSPRQGSPAAPGRTATGHGDRGQGAHGQRGRHGQRGLPAGQDWARSLLGPRSPLPHPRTPEIPEDLKFDLNPPAPLERLDRVQSGTFTIQTDETRLLGDMKLSLITFPTAAGPRPAIRIDANKSVLNNLRVQFPHAGGPDMWQRTGPGKISTLEGNFHIIVKKMTVTPQVEGVPLIPITIDAAWAPDQIRRAAAKIGLGQPDRLAEKMVMLNGTMETYMVQADRLDLPAGTTIGPARA